MKIIENNHDKFPIQARCYNCNSLILLESEEELSQSELCEGNEYFWECPCCYMCNIIKIDEI